MPQDIVRHGYATGSPSLHADYFIHAHLEDARHIQRLFGVPASVVLAQSALETGWGRHVEANAWFGVKGTAPDGAHTAFITHEIVDGTSKRVKGGFRAYSSYRAAAEDYARVLRRFFPAAFASRSESLKFASHLAAYATDPGYTRKLRLIIQTHHLTQYDGH